MRITTILAVSAATVVLLGAPASAGVARSGLLTTAGASPSLRPFIFYYKTLQPGVHTVATTGLSAGGDTVLHVLQYDGSGVLFEVAANDDCPGAGLSSCTSFNTIFGSAGYVMWVHSYSTTSYGTANVVVDGVTNLTANPFGGNRLYQPWSSGDVVRVVGAQGAGYGNDFMLFALNTTTQWAGFDDDSGPNFYPKLVMSSTNSSGSFVVGTFPGSSGVARLVQDIGLAPDYDGDGLSDALENLIGTNPYNLDSDADLVDDGKEVLGNDGFSFSEWTEIDRRDLFVEIDRMADAPIPANTRFPYATLPQNAHDIFFADSTNPKVFTSIFIDPSVVPWHEFICYGPCRSDIVGGVNFYDVKAGNFSVNNPERRPYFRYAVWGFRYGKPDLPDTGCITGSSEVGGNDIIISLACTNNLPIEQRGTFIHELGHNLTLGHNGNANSPADGPNSLIHWSVMNYRYQLSGVPPAALDTYSVSTACTSCSTSPKQACVDCRGGGPPGSRCFAFCAAGCDCSLNEWGALSLNTIYSYNNNGAGGAGAAGVGNPSRTKLAGQLPGEERVLKPEAERRAAVQGLESRLVGQGWRTGVDYRRSPDGLHLYSICQ